MPVAHRALVSDDAAQCRMCGHDAHYAAAARTWLQHCIDSLFGNQIGDAGARAVAATLKPCKALTTL